MNSASPRTKIVLATATVFLLMATAVSVAYFSRQSINDDAPSADVAGPANDQQAGDAPSTGDDPGRDDTQQNVVSSEGREFWLELEIVADGFTMPVQVVDPGDGTGRLFVVEKPGAIRIIQRGEVLGAPFLDISSNVQSTDPEQGMLGLAFHPDYAVNGYVYVTYSPDTHEWRLSRFTVSDDPNVLDPNSEVALMSADHPGNTHYGGMVTFGPDGYLWVSIGDGGGGAYDPNNNSQDRSTLHGSLLRIDVDGDFPYAVPPDNPFVDHNEYRPEIWAYGLRNPWRFSFDRETGDIFIGDAGEYTFEEVNVEPAGSGGGLNYGWPEMEGPECSGNAPDCDPSLYVPPVLAYGREQGCAVTGGYVYRGDPSSPVYGTYIFSDFCIGTVWTMNRGEDGEWHGEVHLQTTLHISSFGEDADGNLYAADFTAGGIYQVVARTQTPEPVAQRVEPDMYIAGGVSCTMHVRGWNFQPGASVRASGQDVPVEYVDGTWLSFSSGDLPASDGPLLVTVVNHGEQDVESQPLELAVIADLVGGDAIYQNWARTDLPVQSGEETRTWMWGLPMGSACVELEAYEDSPGGMRAVQYFDKSRMEVTDPVGDPTSEWYVTNGLLVIEMVTGRVQLGDNAWDEREPASINIAGDRQDPDGPTYGTIGALLDAPALEDGATVTQRVERGGTVTEDPAFAAYSVTAAHRVDVAGVDRQIASPFWEFMNATGTVFDGDSFSDATLFQNPFFATGLPIIDPYWARVRVAGEEKDVLIQCFERRCLTYTPSNDPEWQVEAGNVGHHYYLWRYERWR